MNYDDLELVIDLSNQLKSNKEILEKFEKECKKNRFFHYYLFWW